VSKPGRVSVATRINSGRRRNTRMDRHKRTLWTCRIRNYSARLNYYHWFVSSGPVGPIPQIRHRCRIPNWLDFTVACSAIVIALAHLGEAHHPVHYKAPLFRWSLSSTPSHHPIVSSFRHSRSSNTQVYIPTPIPSWPRYTLLPRQLPRLLTSMIPAIPFANARRPPANQF